MWCRGFRLFPSCWILFGSVDSFGVCLGVARCCTLEETEAVLTALRAHGTPRLLEETEAQQREDTGMRLKEARGAQLAAAQATCASTADSVSRLTALRAVA